jgi:cytochrome c oxidase subunit 2
MDGDMTIVARAAARMAAPGRALLAFAMMPAVLLAAAPAMASQPQPWQIGMQPAATSVGQRVQDLHELIMWIITGIVLFVAALLAYVIWRYNAKRNPNPSATSHNTTIEVLWTVVPVLILVVIAIPSFQLLYYQDRARDADLTIRVTGFQWAWQYDYPDHGNFTFESRMVQDRAELRPDQPWLLGVDNEMVVPVGKVVRILTTSRDVIHSFFMPAFGVQKYNIPGRTLETWFRVDRPGVYYGQCNQICGVQHAYMPIAVRAVPEAEFNAWVEQARTRFASADAPAAPPPAPAYPLTIADVRR